MVATNRNLEDAAAEGRFRKDLYYRLRTHCIVVPPLRDRIDDIPLLLDHFLDKAAKALGKKKPTPPPELAPLLASYAFPGNVRELEGMVHDAVSSHKARMLSMEVFAARIGVEGPAPAQMPPEAPSDGVTLFSGWDRLPTLKGAMQDLIAEALHRAEGNQALAAKLLGVTRAALNKRITRARRPAE
jgi:transcriptional regulator with GAF, ATPase, and Fis domain